MARKNTIQIIINAKDNASSVLSGAASNIKSIGKAATIAATVGIAAATVAITAFAAKSISAFTGFQNSMNEVFTLLPDITNEAMVEMESGIQRLSRVFGTLTEDAVPALYQAISAGVPKDNVFQFLEIANKAAIGGVTSLETAVDGITSVVNAYGSEILSATQASDLMFTAVKLGKCVTGDTRVLLADGRYKRIDELQDGGTIVSYDGRNFVPMKAQWVDQGVKPTVTLRTRLGREIVTTWNHPYLSITKEQDYRSTKQPKWRKVSDLSVGDKIAVPTSLPYFGETEVPEHMAGLLGLWLAEGNSNSASPRITTTQYEAELQSWASEWDCSIRNVESRDGFAPQYLLSSGRNSNPNPIMEWLRSLGLGEGTSANKHIPDDIFTWDRASIAILLRWLFNGDGWLADLRGKGRSGFQLGFCSKSEQLVRDVSHLLLRFGIVGRIRFRKEVNAWVWEINRYAEIERFVKLIGIDRDTAALVLQHQPEKQRSMWGVVEYDPIVEIVEGDEQHVYDLCVEELHNFVANDIVAHNTDFEQLSASLSMVTPTAASMGLGFDNVAAAMATMTAQGINTATSTTALNGLLSEIADSGTDVGKAFTNVAGVGFRDFIAQGGNLSDALNLLEQAATDTGVPIDEMFGNIRAGKAALALTGRNAESFADALAEMGASAGATDAAFERMSQGTQFQFNRLKASIQNFLIDTGRLLDPFVGRFVKGFADVINIFSNFLTGIQLTKAEMVDLLSETPRLFRPLVAAIAPVITAFSRLAKDFDPNNPDGFFGAIKNGMSIVDAASIVVRRFFTIAGAGQGVIDFAEGLTRAFVKLAGNIRMVGITTETVGVFIWDIARAFGVSAETAAAFADKVEALVGWFQNAISPVTDWLKNTIQMKDVMIAFGIAIAAFVIPAIAGIIAGLIAMALPFVALIAAVALLRTAWETDFGGIRTFIINTVLPALDRLFDWFMDTGLPAIQTFVTDTALPAIKKLFDFLVTVWDLISPALGSMFKWFTSNGLPAIQTGITKAKAVFDEFIEVITFLWDNISPGLNTMKEWFTTNLPLIQDGFSIVADAIQAVIDKLTAGVQKAREFFAAVTPGDVSKKFLGIDTSMVGGGFRTVGRAFNPFNALGGDVQSGVPTIVGETGREMFVPQTDGQIITNRDTEAAIGNSGGSTNMTININGIPSQADAQEAATRVVRALRAQGVPV